jgi:hypothetical protein
MRADLISAVASKVNSFHVLRQSNGYDYQNDRQRQIFENLTQGVQYVFNNAVEGDIAEFGTGSGFSALTIAHAMAIFGNMYTRYLKLMGHLATRRTR